MSEPDSPPQEFPNRSIQLDDDAAACWELAAWIGAQSSDDDLRSFTSLLIALLHAENGLSQWFLRYARAAGIHLEEIYAARQFRPGALRAIKERRARAEVPSGKPAFTVSVRNLADGATDLLHLTSGTLLGVRHLLGAYFYRLPEAHVKQMPEWGFDLGREASAFVRQMHTRHTGEIERWTEIHTQAFSSPPDLRATDPILPPRVSSFAPDTPEGSDQLNIEDDIYALSALICSTRVSPPLSIGLFGDWGSGKSFFIRQLQRGVSFISEHARGSGRMQKDIGFYKNVVQIEFNAWNYSGGNLWAALVQHILENLRLSKDESENLVAKRVQYLKQQMQLEQEVRAAAAAREQGAQKEVDDTQQKLETLRQQHEREVNELKRVLEQDVLETLTLDQATLEQLNGLRQELGLPDAVASAGEFLAAVEGTRSVLTRASALFEYVPAEQRKRFIANSALVLVIPPLTAAAIGAASHWLNPYVASISALAGWVSAGLGLGARWLQQRNKDLSVPLAQLERLQMHARQRVEAEQQKHRAEAASLEQRISLAKDEILAAQAKQQEAESRLQLIQAEIASTTPARVLADFVRERAQSEDYRRYLGLPAVIRRDFESISRMVAQENAALTAMESLEQEKDNADQRINRIVLYIDDLDRCPEPLVVDVLKAVHLLLAFPLFVVVVAVDARWVSRSLATQFPGLLIGKDHNALANHTTARTEHATPSDYLEKIFQIPFWLRTPSEDAVKRMVRGLINENLTRPVTGSATDKPEPGPEVPHTPEPAAVFKRRQHDPHAAALDIQPEEADYMGRLAPLLDRSPRALKRFVNVYRLLKASLPAEEQDTFMEHDNLLGAPFQTVLLLLALVNGLPALSDALLDALLVAKYGDGVSKSQNPATLEQTIAALEKDDDEVREQASRLTAWLEVNCPDWKAVPAAGFLTWAQRVARYSYHLHRG